MELTGGGSTRFSSAYRGTLDDIFATQERLAEEIRGDICTALGRSAPGLPVEDGLNS